MTQSDTITDRDYCPLPSQTKKEREMETLKLTAEHFDAEKKYIGTVDVSNYPGHIEIAANLGYVKFKKIAVMGRLVALAGTGIKAGRGIEAGEGIEAGRGIEAGLSITCKLRLISGLRIFAGLCIWRLPSENESTIRCGLAMAAEVHAKNLIETGLPDESAEQSVAGAE